MPQIFRLGSYVVYFWANENKPLEPVHVHVCKGHPVANATKIWITQNGKCCLAHNKSRILDRALSDIIRVIESRSDYIIRMWTEYFGGDANYYC